MGGLDGTTPLCRCPHPATVIQKEEREREKQQNRTVPYCQKKELVIAHCVAVGGVKAILRAKACSFLTQSQPPSSWSSNEISLVPVQCPLSGRPLNMILSQLAPESYLKPVMNRAPERAISSFSFLLQCLDFVINLFKGRRMIELTQLV